MGGTFKEWHAELLSYGYKDMPEINGIKVGDRVRHRGERYPKAYQQGTAVVLAVMERDPSAWTREWGQRDIELIIERDADLREEGHRLSQWADYHTSRIEPVEQVLR